MLTDLAGPIINKLGNNYVNDNSRDKKRERKTAFWGKGHKEKKIDSKNCKNIKSRNLNSLYPKFYIRKFISKSLYEKVYIKVYKNLLEWNIV